MAAIAAAAAYVALRQGALGDAESAAREALALAGPASARVGRDATAILAEALMRRGELEAAAELVADADDPQLLTVRGKLALAQRRPHDALADLLRGGDRLASLEIEGVAPVRWRPAATQAAVVTGDASTAEVLATEELAFARAFGERSALGIAIHAYAMLTDGDQRISLLQDAVATLAGTPARLEHARALVDLGAAMRRSRRRTDAREPLRKAAELALLCGATTLMAEARTELAAAGARPRGLFLRGPESLTVSERRVAEQAAAGLTNREIAAALFVTCKTVEAHLRSCFRKLDVSSRRELPGVLAAA